MMERKRIRGYATTSVICRNAAAQGLVLPTEANRDTECCNRLRRPYEER